MPMFGREADPTDQHRFVDVKCRYGRPINESGPPDEKSVEDSARSVVGPVN